MIISATLRVFENGALKTGTPCLLAEDEIDLVRSDTEAAERKQALRLREGLRRDVGLAPDAEHVDVADLRGELVLLEGVLHRLDAEALAREDLARARVDVLEEEDSDLVLGVGRRNGWV